MRNRLFALMMISTAWLQAADNKESAGTPSLGFAYNNASRELRAILGVPGAARWSDPLPLPEGFVSARVAPGHRWALVKLESGEVGILQLDTLAYSRLTDIAADAPSDPSGLQFSPSGTSMALRTGGDGGIVTVWTGIPSAPSKLEATQAISGRYAVSDSGSLAAVVDSKLVRDSVTVAECPDCVFAFFAGSNSLAVADSVSVREVVDATQSRLIAEGLEAYTRIFATAENVALSGENVLQVVNRRSGVIKREEMQVTANVLESMRSAEILLLTKEGEDGVSWMYSSEGIRFVPARNAAEVKE
jgi:hypothetical protein